MSQSTKITLEVRASLDPGSLARVSNVFTVRGIIPREVICRKEADHLAIAVALESAEGSDLERIIHRIEALVCVMDVAAGSTSGGGDGGIARWCGVSRVPEP